MFVIAPLRTAASGLLDGLEAAGGGGDPLFDTVDQALIRSRVELIASAVNQDDQAAADLDATRCRPYPSTPFYGVLSQMTIEVSRATGGNGFEPAALVHRHLEHCLSSFGSMYYCGTSTSLMTSSMQADDHSQQPLLYCKYIDACCDAFLKLEQRQQNAQGSQLHGTADAAGTSSGCSDVLYWTMEKHERFKDSRSLFFLENGALCGFVHTSSRALRDHLSQWFGKIVSTTTTAGTSSTASEGLDWVDGGVFVTDAGRQAAAGGVSRVRALFDLLLNLKIFGIGEQQENGGMKKASLSTSSLALSATKAALLTASLFVPSGLHVSLVASFPFAFGEHRAPKLRAVKMVRRAAQAPQSRAERSDAEEVFSWTLVAVPGYYILPPLLHRLMTCLRDQCRLNEFALHLVPVHATAPPSAGGPQSLGGKESRHRMRQAPMMIPAGGQPSRGMQLLKRSGAGGAAWDLLSLTSVPHLVFSRLSSVDWLDDKQRLQYSTGASPLDEDGADLEFYPSKVAFRRSEWVRQEPRDATGRKRSRGSSIPQRRSQSPDRRGEFSITTVVVYAPTSAGDGTAGNDDVEAV